MNPVIADRGAYVEVLIGAPKLRGADAIDVLAAATNTFGDRSLLVICDDPRAEVSLDDAYRIGRAMAERLPSRRIAIALRGRTPSETERFIELVAANRGSEVRYFDDVQVARSWLAA